MRKRFALSLVTTVVMLLAACSSPVQRAADAPTSSVTGTVTYHVQTALPPDAVVTVELHAGADAGSATSVIGQQQITTSDSQAPFAFEIVYKPETINQDHVYSVGATIQGADGSPLFASDANVPVITKGSPVKDVEVVVVPVSGAEQDAGSGLVGETWQVVSLNGNPPVADTTITAQFGADGTLTGSDGCNNYTASYQVDQANIKITPGIGTLMACPDAVMAQATAYQAALTAAAVFVIDGGMLNLVDANGATILTYKVVAQELAGTSWEAILFNNGASAIVGVTGVQITADFGADGQVSGFSGCNTYSATYQAANNAIAFGPMAVTQKACTDPDGVMEQESQYLAALASATAFEIQGPTLEMQTSSGEIAVQFQRVGP